ncbi:MAG TPA: tRNA 4-thiouridine(8) synthase ThiI [Clostridiales bacterium]|nr:tRNA 4-thiouridine(8) synthase ThiI [Clostridiales bacterium]
MQSIILVRCGEIMLKGLNRHAFERVLLKNIRHSLEGMGEFGLVLSQSRIYVEPKDDSFVMSGALRAISRVPGITSVSPAWKIPTDWPVIKQKAVELTRERVSKNSFHTFKVDARRGDKSFFLDSPGIMRELGAMILEQFPEFKVDVKNPDFTVFVEVREQTYLYTECIPGCGGLPVGTGGKGLLLLSGGIDSPVAGWMMARRGMTLEGIHFFSYPYTSLRSREKVQTLGGILSSYSGYFALHVVPFTSIQETIRDKVPEDHQTILTRRIMMQIAQEVAEKRGLHALITGESLGQVASQTIQGLTVTGAGIPIPILRPLIGMDKNEVVELARKIGTYETSILPYEDCCTVFNSRHPNTRPRTDRVQRYESRLDLDEMVKKALSDMETMKWAGGRSHEA